MVLRIESQSVEQKRNRVLSRHNVMENIYRKKSLNAIQIIFFINGSPMSFGNETGEDVAWGYEGLGKYIAV